jgi:hypothetical protein
MTVQLGEWSLLILLKWTLVIAGFLYDCWTRHLLQHFPVIPFSSYIIFRWYHFAVRWFSCYSIFRLYHLPVLLKIRFISFSVIPSSVTPILGDKLFKKLEKLLSKISRSEILEVGKWNIRPAEHCKSCLSVRLSGLSALTTPRWHDGFGRKLVGGLMYSGNRFCTKKKSKK